MAPLSVARLVEPTVAELVDVVEIFDRYRSHYGEPVTPGRTLEWLQQQAGRGRLTVFTARLGAGLVGFATTVETPASLRLGHYWQLRDLYVAPDARRSGVGRALLAKQGDGVLTLILRFQAAFRSGRSSRWWSLL